MSSENLRPTSIGYLPARKADKIFNVNAETDIFKVGFFRKDTENLKTSVENAVRRIQKFLPKIKKSTRILILNAGYGRTARFLAETYGCKVDCLNSIELQNKYQKKQTAGTDLEELISVKQRESPILSFGRETFDFVIADADMMFDQQKKQTFREIGRVLKPEGRFVFTGILKNQFCPDGVLRTIQKYTEFAEPETAASYRDLAKRADMEKIFIKKTPEKLLTYYNKLTDNVESSEFAKATSKAFQEDVLAKTETWADAVEAGHLNYGLLLFQKRNG